MLVPHHQFADRLLLHRLQKDYFLIFFDADGADRVIPGFTSKNHHLLAKIEIGAVWSARVHAQNNARSPIIKVLQYKAIRCGR